MHATLPDLAAIVDPLLGAPYEQFDCWRLTRHLYRAGWEEDLDEKPEMAWKHVTEIWWQEDSEDPLEIVQPWDLLIMRGRGMASHHVGISVNQVYFTHTRKRVGVCLEPVRRWAPRLLQIARLRRLL